MNRYRELVESWREGVIPPDSEPARLQPTKTVPTLPHDGESRQVLSSALVDSLLDSAQPMCVCDAAGELVFANTPYHNLLVLSARGTPPAESQPIAGHEVFQAELAQTRRPIERTHHLVIGNTKRHYSSRHIPLADREGEFAGTYGLYTDVTETQAAERQKVRILEHSDLLIRSISDWIWKTDTELALTEISRGISGITGLPPKLLKGISLLELGNLEASESSGVTPQDLFRRRAPFRNLPYRLIDTQGRERYFRLSGMPVFDDVDHRFTGYHGTATEVTTQVEAEEEAKASRVELEQTMRALVERNRELGVANESAIAATQSKSKFLAMKSHELRTPLNAIIGFSELSAMKMFGELDEPYLGYSKDILAAAKHLLGVINDVLDVAKIESDALTVVSEPVALSGVLADAKFFVALQSEKRNIDISAVSTDSDITLIGDPVRLRQVMINLLGNAVKFTEPGGQVGVSIDRKVVRMADITVWDTGVGIPADKLDQVFESFQQVGQDIEHRPHEGTGLGLTISRHLVHLMGGEILLESEVDKGSQFTVRLPLNDEDASSSASVAAKSDGSD